MKMVFVLFKHFLFPIICHLKFYSSIVHIYFQYIPFLPQKSDLTILDFPQHFTFPGIFKDFCSSFYLGNNNIETVCIKYNNNNFFPSLHYRNWEHLKCNGILIISKA